MDIKIKNKNGNVSVIFENSNREFKYTENKDSVINTKEKMTIVDFIKALYLAGKNDDVVFIEAENE